MATYITGVTDFIPQIQPFSPDFNFYQNALERKQGQYDQGWQKTNTIYNSILNAPMLRQQNMNKRDQFFKDAEQQIQKMSSIDLSLQQNVDAASQVFKPFYEDNNIVKDIGFTKKFQDEMQTAEALRTCLDKEACGDKYWSGGVRALQHKAKEFVDASDEGALGMSAPKFTPYVNVMEKATKAAKEAGLSVEYDSIQGGYMVKTKNGPALQQPLMTYFMSRFGDNPEVQDYFGTKAYLLRKENPEAAVNAYEAAMMRSQAQSEEHFQSAIQDRADRVNYEKATATIDRTKNNQKSEFDQIVLGKKAVQGQIKREGIVKGGPLDRGFRQLIVDEDNARTSKDSVNEVATMVSNMQYVDENGRQIPGRVMDGVVANAMMMREFNLAANTLSYQDYSVTKKADPYALASFRNNMRRQNMAIQHQYGMDKISYKAKLNEGTQYRKMLIQYGYINPMSGMPRYIDPSAQTMEVLPGGGMAGGDPADRAAAMRQQLTGASRTYAPGNVMFDASVGARVAPGAKRVSGETSASPDVFMPKAYTQFKQQAFGIPGALKGGLPGQTLTGFREQDKNLAVTFTGKGKEPDVRVATAITQFNNGSISHTQLRQKVDDVITDIGSIAEGYLNYAGDKKEEIVRERLTEFITIAADNGHEHNQVGLQAMYHVGNMVKGTENTIPYDHVFGAPSPIKEPTSMMEQFFPVRENGEKVTGIDALKWRFDRLKPFNDFPSANNSKNLTPEYFKGHLSKDVDDLIIAAGGIDPLYKLFVKGGAPEYIMRAYDDHTAAVNVSDVNIVSPSQYKSFANRDADISRWEEIENNVKKGVDYPSNNADFQFYSENPYGFDQLTSEEQESVKKYDYYTGQPTYPKASNQMGLNSIVESVQQLNKEDLKSMGLVQWHEDEARRLQTSFRNQMTGVAESFANRSVEKTMGADDPVSIAESIIAQNMWNPKLNGGLGGMQSTDAIYNAMGEDGRRSWRTFDAIREVNPADFLQENSLTATQLEETYMGGRPNLSNKSIHQMLKHSELSSESFPLGINSNNLWRRYGQSGEKIDLDQGSGFDQNSGHNQWQALMMDADTKVVRTGNKVTISNPTLMPGSSSSYDLSQIELSRGFEHMFENIHDNVGPMRADFMNKAQQTPTNNLILPTQYLGGAGGNFSFTSGSLNNMQIQAGIHNQAHEEGIPLLREIQGHLGDDLTSYSPGLEQGNETLLNVITSTFAEDALYKMGDKKRPGIEMNVDPIYGHMNMSRVTVKLDPNTAHGFLKERGMAKYNNNEGLWEYKDLEGNPLPMESSYYIANSQSDLIQKTKPNPYRSLVGFSEGESYVDDTFWESMGGKVRFKRQKDAIAVTMINKVWDTNSKDYVELATDPMMLPLNGTDWQMQIQLLYDQIFQNPYRNSYLMQNEEYITDPNYHQNEQ